MQAQQPDPASTELLGTTRPACLIGCASLVRYWGHFHGFPAHPPASCAIATAILSSFGRSLSTWPTDPHKPSVRHFRPFSRAGWFHQALTRVVEEREGTCGIWDDHVRATVETVESADKFLDDLLSTKAQKKYRPARTPPRRARQGHVRY